LSQVIVTNDQLKDRRESSRKQESQIDTASFAKRWQLNNIAQHDSQVRQIVLVVFAPLFALWAVLMLGLSFAVGLFSILMRTLGKLVPR
jgi:hypothetical protein